MVRAALEKKKITGTRLEGEGTIRDPRKSVLEVKQLKDKRRRGWNNPKEAVDWHCCSGDGGRTVEVRVALMFKSESLKKNMGKDTARRREWDRGEGKMLRTESSGNERRHAEQGGSGG